MARLIHKIEMTAIFKNKKNACNAASSKGNFLCPIGCYASRFSFFFPFAQLFFFLCLFSACDTTKYLEADKAFLNKNSITLQAKPKIKDATLLKEDLKTLYKQKPNTYAVVGRFVNRRWFWYRTEGKVEKKGFYRWVRKQFGEKPAVFDEKLSNATAESMRFFLQNKGYMDAEVYFDKNFRRKKVNVTYIVHPNRLYSINDVTYKSQDATLERIMNDVKNETVFEKGKPLNSELYNQEIARLTRTFRNLGYAFFYPNYFSPLSGDTTNFKTNIMLEVLPPLDTTAHRKYKVGRIAVYTDYEVGKNLNTAHDTLVEGVHIRYFQNELNVKPNTILSNTFLRTNDVYRQENYDQTYNKLYNLRFFKFINIKQQIDSSDKTKVNYEILLSPYRKMSAGFDAELNSVSNGNNVSASAFSIGGAASLNFRNRNTFGGAEIFNLSLGGGLYERRNPQRFEIKLASDLQIPRFLDAYNFWKTLNAVHLGKKKELGEDRYRKLLSDHSYNTLKEKASTKIGVGMQWVVNTKFYTYQSFNAQYGLVFQPSPTRRLSIDQTAIDYFRPTLSDSLPEFQRKRLGKQFFTGFLFRALNYSYQSPVTRLGNSWFTRTSVEVSGHEIFAINKLYDVLAKKDAAFQLSKDIDYSRYVRLELETGFAHSFNEKTSIHFRSDIGVASAYGYNASVPYIKQFYAGGPNSIRAWNIRELGTGGSNTLLQNNKPGDIPNNKSPYYESGDLKLVANAELRFNLFWIVRGAIFLDAGNVWDLKNRPNASLEEQKRVFTPRFWDDIAIGTGAGLRIDFSYFIFRLDLGLPVRLPYLDPDPAINSHWLYKGALPDRERFKVWHLTLGYPF